MPGMKATVAFNQVFVDPYSGAILGQRNTSDFVLSRLNFMPFMLRLHYSLFLPDGHPNSPTFGHLKFPHPERGVTAG